MKKVTKITTLVLAFVLLLCGCQTNQPGSQPTAGGDAPKTEPITIQIGSTLVETGTQSKAMAEFKRLVEQDTDGRVIIDLKMNSVLGTEDEMLDQVKLGVIGGILTGGYSTSNTSDPRLAVEEIPFLFANEEEARRAYNGAFGEVILEILESIGYQPICFFENGMRHITNNIRPIVTPDDLSGLKLRVVGEVRIKTFKALGASPTTMAIGEVYSGLQQGALDGQENPFSTIINRSFYETQKYLSLSGHIYNTAVLMVSPSVWLQLSDDDRAVIQRAAREAQQVNYDANDEYNQTAIATCESKGMIVNKVDAEAFVEAVAPVWREYESVIGADLIELARSSAKQ
jgi:tripartite ATP-independent transporter DctP family solute receptor